MNQNVCVCVCVYAIQISQSHQNLNIVSFLKFFEVKAETVESALYCILVFLMLRGVL